MRVALPQKIIKINNMEEKQNQGKPSVSTPPPPKVSIRTMESDIKAIEEGGGEMTAPKVFTPPKVKLEEPEVEGGIKVPGYIGPEKPIFAPVADASREKPLVKESPQSSKWKFILIIVGIVIIVVGFGLLGYFVVSSWIFPKQMPSVQ
jgi:hypothetical protein